MLSTGGKHCIQEVLVPEFVELLIVAWVRIKTFSFRTQISRRVQTHLKINSHTKMPTVLTTSFFLRYNLRRPPPHSPAPVQLSYLQDMKRHDSASSVSVTFIQQQTRLTVCYSVVSMWIGPRCCGVYTVGMCREKNNFSFIIIKCVVNSFTLRAGSAATTWSDVTTRCALWLRKWTNRMKSSFTLQTKNLWF